jgi:hypothetical protein
MAVAAAHKSSIIQRGLVTRIIEMASNMQSNKWGLAGSGVGAMEQRQNLAGIVYKGVGYVGVVTHRWKVSTSSWQQNEMLNKSSLRSFLVIVIIISFIVLTSNLCGE